MVAKWHLTSCETPIGIVHFVVSKAGKAEVADSPSLCSSIPGKSSGTGLNCIR